MDKKKILAVDDDRTTRYFLEHFIVETGYSPIICEDGEQAIPHIGSADLLITDLNMPGINGAELTKIAKREKPDMPVIIITGDPKGVPVDHLADMVIEKPFKFERLKEIVADFLRNK